MFIIFYALSLKVEPSESRSAGKNEGHSRSYSHVANN